MLVVIVVPVLVLLVVVVPVLTVGVLLGWLW